MVEEMVSSLVHHSIIPLKEHCFLAVIHPFGKYLAPLGGGPWAHYGLQTECNWYPTLM